MPETGENEQCSKRRRGIYYLNEEGGKRPYNNVKVEGRVKKATEERVLVAIYMSWRKGKMILWKEKKWEWWDQKEEQKCKERKGEEKKIRQRNWWGK